MPIVTRIWLGAVLAALVAVAWIGPAVLGLVIEAPVQAFARWARDTGGAPLTFGLAAAIPIAGGIFTLWAHRRDQRRRYASDRTLHVEQSRWTPAFKRRFALMCLPVGLVFVWIALDTLVL